MIDVWKNERQDRVPDAKDLEWIEDQIMKQWSGDSKRQVYQSKSIRFKFLTLHLFYIVAFGVYVSWVRNVSGLAH